MIYTEEYWATTQEERQEKDVKVPYKTEEFMKWLEDKGYKNSTIHNYIINLLNLDKFIITRRMPMEDVYEEFPKVFEDKDFGRFRNLCKQYEKDIDIYLSLLEGGIDIDTKMSAEYDDIRKYRSVWRTYTNFLGSLFNGTIDEKTIINSCIIPLKDEFIEYLQNNSNTAVSTAKTYICRLRSMNDKFLSIAFPEEDLPFHACDFEYNTSRTIDILNTCIQHIEDNIRMECNNRTILKLKGYIAAAQLYIGFLKQYVKN